MKKIYLYILLSIPVVFTADACCSNDNDQKIKEYLMRLDAALHSVLLMPDYAIAAENNGDATGKNLYAPAHTKSLEHDAATGLLTPSGVQNYQQLLKAIDSTKQIDYNAIVRFPGSSKFVNPQGSNLLTLQGIPNNLLPMPLFPLLSTPKAAALLIELYLQTICRSVLFSDYGTGAGTDRDTINGGSITHNAAAILTGLGDAYEGPKINHVVTPDLLFKIDAKNSLIGPSVSQFEYCNVPILFQPHRIFIPYVDLAQNREFGVSWSDFVAIQNGLIPRPYISSDFTGQAYITRGRDLATLVHSDGPGEIFFYAVNSLILYKFPFSTTLPYYNGTMLNEAAFVDMNTGDVYSALFDVVNEALKHAWAHKWRAQRVLRPDAFAGLVHKAKVTDTNPNNLYSTFFATYQTPAGKINLLNWVKSYNSIQETNAVQDPLTPPAAETYLLSQMFPDGAPAHPSYPSGHGTLSGACITVIKAFFNDDELIKNHVTPKKPDPADATQLVNVSVHEGSNLLTVGGELNKLACNVAMGRNFAGIHYRMDALEGILIGEQVALHYLQDHARMYNEQGFTGFELTTFQGQRVRVTADAIEVIG